MTVKLSALAPLLTNDTLQLIVLPTEKCNFRCEYCYEDFEHDKMSSDTVGRLKKLIEHRAPKLRHLEVSWFGGEPLLAKEIIYDLNSHAIGLADSYGASFASEITTNGFALDFDTFERLCELRVSSYQISLDGEGESHDRTRKLISGKGTFERIWSNIIRMRESSRIFNVVLRLHVHRTNVQGIKSLLGLIERELLGDPRFNIVLKPVGDWGGTSVKKLSLLGKEDSELAEIHRTVEQMGWHRTRRAIEIDPPASNESSAAVHACYAARPNSLVIRSTGQLAKCTVAFSDPRNNVGYLERDGTIRLERDKMLQFMRGFESLSHEELTCPMHGMPKIAPGKVIFLAPVPAQ